MSALVLVDDDEPDVAELFVQRFRAHIRLPTAALSLMFATGLGSKIKPLSCASLTRSGACRP